MLSRALASAGGLVNSASSGRLIAAWDCVSGVVLKEGHKQTLKYSRVNLPAPARQPLADRLSCVFLSLASIEGHQHKP